MVPDGFGDIEGVHSEEKEGVKESYRRIDIVEEVEEMLDAELSKFNRSNGRMDKQFVLKILEVLMYRLRRRR